MMLNIYRSIFAFNLIAATALFLICLYLSDPRYQLVALGHFAFTTLLFFPVAMRTKVRPIEPFNLVVLYVAIGTLGNSYIIAFSESTRREVLTNGEPIELFIWGALWLCSGLFVLGFGYSMTTRRVPVERILPNEARISSMGIHVSTLLALGLSVIATLVFVESTGGLSATVSEISRKRAIEVVSDGEIVYASAGYLRLVAGLPMLYLYILLSYYLRRSETLTHGNKALLLALLIAGLAIPFIASSRASIAYSMIGLLVVYSVYRPISMKMLVVAGVISLAFFSAMTGLRATSQQKLTDSKVLVNPIVAIAQSGNGVSLNGTALIMDGVPERMDFKLGYTFLTWLASPIPRSVWPNKPDISLGKEIKGTILQKTVIKSGRPPSFLTEGFINFGYPGFFLCAFLFGVMLRLVAISFIPILHKNIFASGIYFIFVLHIAALSNGALSQAVVRILSDLIPIYIIFLSMQILGFRTVHKQRTTNIGPLSTYGPVTVQKSVE